MFEQPGVREIRERKARREERWHRERNGEEEYPEPPHRNSIEWLVWDARRRQNSPEEKAKRERIRREVQAKWEQEERERVERCRCPLCGADIINYSHSFMCPRRGTGF